MSEAIGITFCLTFILTLLIGIAVGITGNHCYKSLKYKNNAPMKHERQIYEDIDVSQSKPSNEELSMGVNPAYLTVHH